MVVKVKAKHIRKGVPISTCNCPVALALKERLHKFVDVDVDVLTYFPDGAWHMLRRRCDTPDKVKKFIKDFDDMRAVKPFSFSISFKNRYWV